MSHTSADIQEAREVLAPLNYHVDLRADGVRLCYCEDRRGPNGTHFGRLADALREAIRRHRAADAKHVPESWTARERERSGAIELLHILGG